MPPNASPVPGPHPDAAGWVLSALDADDTVQFMLHLQSCAECRTTIDELRPVAQAMARPAPAVEPPAGLEARTLAAVQQAARAEKTQVKATRWWQRRLDVSLLSVASALGSAAVIIAAFFFLPILQTAPAEATIVLSPPATGGPASGRATILNKAGTRSIQLTVRGLKDLGPGWLYECGYTIPGQHKWITAGSFMIGRNGGGNFAMTSAADPQLFTTMQIRAERLGDFRPADGRLILSGTLRRT